MSAPVKVGGPSDAPDKVAALSLCAMGQGFLFEQPHKVYAQGDECPYSPKNDHRKPIVLNDYRSKTVDCPSPTSVIQQSTGRILPSKTCTPRHKESKHDPVSFEEMKRLMRVYGPTKCLRNRSPNESGKFTKVHSVKRKFYRWFPDLHERFVLQAGGWYMPKIGHEEEMRYREELRMKDQQLLAAKRNRNKNSLA
ncbi:hypothetical protein ACHAWF_015956 [Thalassiosira exigua]